MACIKSSSRYSSSTTSSSFLTTTHSPRSSTKSDPSSSTDNLYSSKSSRAVVRTNDRNNNSFSSLVKRFIETKSNTSSLGKAKKGSTDPMKLVIAADYLAADLKKPGGGQNATPVSLFHKKLFRGSKREEAKSDRKALTEVKGNTRTLAMVLRSERELLSSNKELEAEIAELKLTLEEKNREVDKLKDLCLKQREEIKSLKSAILFPDVMNSQLEKLLEKQGSELKQAKQLIPSLQKQVSSLSGQLQCIAVDLAEVKADKYSTRGFYDTHNSPRTSVFDQDDAANSLDFSSSSHTPVGSPDDLFLKDQNPCLTPHDVRKKLEVFEKYDSTDDERPLRNNSSNIGKDVAFEGCARKLSISSDYRQRPKTSSRPVRAACRSDESKGTLGKQMMHHKRF